MRGNCGRGDTVPPLPDFSSEIPEISRTILLEFLYPTPTPLDEGNINTKSPNSSLLPVLLSLTRHPGWETYTCKDLSLTS